MTTQGVSVIVPTYNRAALIGRAVQSALAQIREGDEIIVIDDGSTDGTQQALAPFRDLITYVHVPNGGAGKARNRGLALARNPLVAFLDSDDEWQPHKLDLQRTLMEARPDLVYCFSNFAHRDQSGQEQHDWITYWHGDGKRIEEVLGPGVPYSSLSPLASEVADFPVHIGSMYLASLNANYVFTSTLLVRREAASTALHFAEDLNILEDMVCYSRMAGRGPVAYLACETAWQHAHSGFRLTSAGDLARATAMLSMLQRVWGSDPDFLARHGDLYAGVVREQRLCRVRALLGLGRTAEARHDLRSLCGVPILYTALSWLPGFFVYGLSTTRQMVRRSLRHNGRQKALLWKQKVSNWNPTSR